MNNYFELLSIEEKYDIDLNTLNTQYFAMQLKYHPDKAKTPLEKQNNLAISIDLNKAYQALKDDLMRAEHLLFLNNINLDEPSIRQGMSPRQLNAIWEDLELVENTKDLVKLEDILKNKLEEKEELIKALNVAFKNHDNQVATGFTIKLKYLKNLINDIQLKTSSCK